MRTVGADEGLAGYGLNVPNFGVNVAMEIIRVHAFISGIVQGVGYRFTTQDVAIQHGVTGWVRNLRDGRVEAVFEGEQGAVKALVHWCYQGPRGAVVQDVQVAYEPPEGLQRFEIRR